MAPTANATTDQITAAYATAPLGNNKALTTIELSGLHNQTQAGSEDNNQFDKISTNC